MGIAKGSMAQIAKKLLRPRRRVVAGTRPVTLKNPEVWDSPRAVWNDKHVAWNGKKLA